MAEMKIALSIEEAADYTGIGRNTLRKLVEWDKLPVLKVGRKVLIKKDILELFMTVNEGRDLRDKGNVKAVTRKAVAYVAEKMGVTASTIQRYEAGTIDNTKKLVLDGLADALHVSVEWLKGETEEYESDITDKKEMLIRDAMSYIFSKLPYDMETSESDFSKDLLLLMLQEYELFVDSFRLACRKFKGNEESARLAETMGFESEREYNEIMFLREITHTVNALNDMGDIVRLYSKNPDTAAARLSVLLSGEDSDSV